MQQPEHWQENLRLKRGIKFEETTQDDDNTAITDMKSRIKSNNKGHIIFLTLAALRSKRHKVEWMFVLKEHPEFKGKLKNMLHKRLHTLPYW